MTLRKHMHTTAAITLVSILYTTEVYQTRRAKYDSIRNICDVTISAHEYTHSRIHI
jgi:hypothetical protein